MTSKLSRASALDQASTTGKNEIADAIGVNEHGKIMVLIDRKNLVASSDGSSPDYTIIQRLSMLRGE